jgi:transposase
MKERTTKFEVLAIDLAKNVFQLGGEDARGAVVFEERIKSRESFRVFLRDLDPQVRVLMESGPGAQAWARELQGRGVRVRILPAQRVAEHRSGAKNDRNDCRAILRAGRDVSIEAVVVKSPQALAMQALHRVRSGYLRRRTAITNQIRGLMLEHGIAAPRGAGALATRVPRILEDAAQPLPDLLRELIAELWAEVAHLSARIESLSARLEAAAREDSGARRLMSIPGIGPITSTALVAKEVRPEKFPNARQFAAYFGLVPDQHSSGQRVRLGRMSKRGDGYIRSLVIQGAHTVLQHLRDDRQDDDSRRLRRWKERHGVKGAAVRLANRNLRIVWALLRHEAEYQRKCA